MSDKRQIGVVMDPIDRIKPAKDTTLAMLLAARRRGWDLWYMEQHDLWLRDGVAGARMRELEVRDSETDWYRFGATRSAALGALDIVLMRKDPPFDMEYVYTTYILDRAELAGVLVANPPGALRDVNEKAYTAWFPQWCPATLISRSLARFREFGAEHGKIVGKPLDGMGGRSVFVLEAGDANANVVFETLTANETRFAMAQAFLPGIREHGDKRILLVDGEPVPYGLARIPAPDDNRGNLAAGARAEGRPLSAQDRAICADVGPVLRKMGLLFVGLDVIAGGLTEINVTSPTCVRELDREFGLDIAGQYMEALEQRLTGHS